MQFKVPQNIDMADRIVGPLTLVQFLYLLLGGIVDYILFSVIAPINVTLYFSVAVPIGIFSFALAFLKIQDQSFGKFVIAFIVYLFRPKTRVWLKEGTEPDIIVAGQEAVKNNRVTHKVVRRADLARLSRTLDTPGRASVTPAAKSSPVDSMKQRSA